MRKVTPKKFLKKIEDKTLQKNMALQHRNRFGEYIIQPAVNKTCNKIFLRKYNFNVWKMSKRFCKEKGLISRCTANNSTKLSLVLTYCCTNGGDRGPGSQRHMWGLNNEYLVTTVTFFKKCGIFSTRGKNFKST